MLQLLFLIIMNYDSLLLWLLLGFEAFFYTIFYVCQFAQINEKKFLISARYSLVGMIQASVT